MTLEETFTALGAHIESLSDRDNERHAETTALEVALALLVSALHVQGVFDAKAYVKLLRADAGLQRSPSIAKLRELADLIDGLVGQIPGHV